MIKTMGKNITEILNKEIYPILPSNLVNVFSKISAIELLGLEEIRLRASKPIMIQKNGEDFFVNTSGVFTTIVSDDLINIDKEDISKMMILMSNYSLYSIEDELKQGFITIYGGHRIGFVGRVISENNKIKVIKNISGLNIRIAREVKGCSDILIKKIFENKLKSTLIVSPPGCGKTTILRDLIRNLSNGTTEFEKRGFKVCIIDERSEISGCYLGIPQNDVGIRTDVLDACPKTEGIYIALRSMSPEIIAVDEISSDEEIKVIKYAINSGVKILATAHGNDYGDIISKPNIKELIDSGALEIIVILSRKNGPGTIEKIINL